MEYWLYGNITVSAGDEYQSHRTDTFSSLRSCEGATYGGRYTVKNTKYVFAEQCIYVFLSEGDIKCIELKN
jgi:hypothetical protein